MQINSKNQLYRRRRLSNTLGLCFSIFAMVFGLTFLGLILFKLFASGLQGLIELPIFTADTPSPNEAGGLRNAIIGSIMITGLGLLIGTPIGIMAGIYLAEFDNGSWLAKATRFMNDILLSAPSIVIGLFIFSIMVQGRGFSGYAGALALALLVIPVVVRTTENMLRLIPNTLREAAYALGTPRWKLVSSVTLRAAKTGVLTGIMLAFARISGETAPLLFTAMNNTFFSLDMTGTMANLPKVIYDYAAQPFELSHKLAWAGALLVTLMVLSLNIIARYIGNKDQH